MLNSPQLFNRRSLLILLSLLLSAGFFATALFSYHVSRQAIRDTLIGQDLPLTSNNIYSEIQKDLIRPVVISSSMAQDTFVRDWVVNGEKDVRAMTRYLAEIKARYGAFSSFFVSERTSAYYTADGVLKNISPTEPRDVWYYRVRQMHEDYEINVDPDLANHDALTIFINFRVFDFDHQYLGATGIGLTVDAVRKLIGEYQNRFKRSIYFSDAAGRVVLGGKFDKPMLDLRQQPGQGVLIDQILADRSGSYQYEANGSRYILHVNYVPELKWYLFVEQNEDEALAEIRHTLLINLAISLLVTLIVIALTHLALARYHRRIEEMATTDKLTGLLNRHAASFLIEQLMLAQRRTPQPISLLLADADHFKRINDLHGHRTGDEILSGIGQILKGALRASDFAVRWGGEEFLIVLPGCHADEARNIAEKLRQRVEDLRTHAGSEQVGTTLSIGYAEYRPEEAMEQTIARADQALYEAKSAGRNLVRPLLPSEAFAG